MVSKQDTGPKKSPRVGLSEKKRIVLDIEHKHLEDAIPMPEACKANGIEVYTYYNWKKRINQLAKKGKTERRIVHQGKSIIIRKMTVAQQVSSGATTNTEDVTIKITEALTRWKELQLEESKVKSFLQGALQNL